MYAGLSSPDPAFLECGAEWPIAVLPYGPDHPGEPVIMLHGLESHSAWFSQSARHIASLGYPVYGMERRGSGHSRAPRGVCTDFNDLVADIDALAEQLLRQHEAEKFHLCGHCFGAIPATAYACSYPHKLRSLVLATPALYTRAEPAFSEKLKVLWAALTRSGLKIPVPLELEWFTDQEQYLDFIREDGLSLHRAGARLYWETARARRFIRAHEQALTMPVFMALAGRDRICDNPGDTEFIGRLPSATTRVQVYDEAIHILEFSHQKQQFFTDLDRWFAETGGTTEKA